jgi:hypothetical protein
VRPHWLYFKFLMRHKWFVFVAGCKTKAPIWRLLIHDLSKFSPAEWNPYVKSFYGPYSYKERPPEVVKAFDRAWLHHQHHNPHHWQSWVLRTDSGVTHPLEIPPPLVREMVADWMGAGRTVEGRWCVDEWYAENRNLLWLHPTTRVLVDHLIEKVSPRSEEPVDAH